MASTRSIAPSTSRMASVISSCEACGAISFASSTNSCRNLCLGSILGVLAGRGNEPDPHGRHEADSHERDDEPQRYPVRRLVREIERQTRLHRHQCNHDYFGDDTKKLLKHAKPLIYGC